MSGEPAQENAPANAEPNPQSQSQNRSLEAAFKPLLDKAAEEEKRYEEIKQRMKIVEELNEHCSQFRGQVLCEEDVITVNYGRYWYYGEIVAINKLSIILNNSGRRTVLSHGKIAMVQIVKRGKWHEKWIEVYGTDIVKWIE